VCASTWTQRFAAASLKSTFATLATIVAAASAQDVGVQVINGFPTEGELWKGTVLVRGAGGCSGSFIGPNLVLTAAHCCSGSSQTGIQIYTGANGDELVGQSIRHSNAGSIFNDMCLVQMSSPKPDSLPHYDVHIDNVPTGSDSVIVGYGLNQTRPDSGFGEARYGLTTISGYQINDIQVRARPGTNPQQNACNGDSGGPIFAANADGQWMVHGVTSRGAANCPVTQTALYVNTVVNEKWLEDTAAAWGVSDLSGIGGDCSSCCYDYAC